MWDHHTLHQRTGTIPGANGRLGATEEYAGRLHNFVLTDEGTLRSVVGPCEYHPRSYANTGGSVPLATVYGDPLLGVHHAVIGGRSILLAHYQGDYPVIGDLLSVWQHKPWSPGWTPVITDNLSLHELSEGTGVNVYAPFEDDEDRPAFRTQFVTTPRGVVIIPQGGRACMTDGVAIYPFGYDRAPAPPQAHGPAPTKSATGVWVGTADELATPRDAADFPNDGGYSHDGRAWEEIWGTCRLGSLRDDVLDVESGGSRKSNPLGGVLLSGEWRAALQWENYFGDLSPLSGLSQPVTFRKEDNLVQEKSKDEPESSAKLRMQVAWSHLQAGPLGTTGRVLARTKDLLNSGMPGLWQLFNNAAAGSFTRVTLPDNVVSVFPDNLPDSWLVLPAVKVDPMPRFRLGEMYDGCFWLARTEDEPNMYRPSLPGRYGTLPEGQKYYADAPVVAMHAIAEGMLLLTEQSVSLVFPSQGGEGYQTRTLRSGAGCVSPDSVATLPSGITLWLGQNKWFAYTSQGVVEVNQEYKEEVTGRITRARQQQAVAAVDPRTGEYRCWVPINGSTTNNVCMICDDAGLWRTRDDVHAAAVCVTQDSRQLMLALGSALVGGTRRNSLWVLDREGGADAVRPDLVTAVVETVWLRNARAQRHGTGVQFSVWLRETRDGEVTFEAFRDGRRHPAVATSTTTVATRATDAWTPLWDDADNVLAGTHREAEYGTYLENYWARRRPFWRREDVFVPSAETLRFRVSGTDWELAGMAYSENDSHKGGNALGAGET